MYNITIRRLKLIIILNKNKYDEKFKEVLQSFIYDKLEYLIIKSFEDSNIKESEDICTDVEINIEETITLSTDDIDYNNFVESLSKQIQGKISSLLHSFIGHIQSGIIHPQSSSQQIILKFFLNDKHEFNSKQKHYIIEKYRKLLFDNPDLAIDVWNKISRNDNAVEKFFSVLNIVDISNTTKLIYKNDRNRFNNIFDYYLTIDNSLARHNISHSKTKQIFNEFLLTKHEKIKQKQQPIETIVCHLIDFFSTKLNIRYNELTSWIYDNGFKTSDNKLCNVLKELTKTRNNSNFNNNNIGPTKNYQFTDIKNQTSSINNNNTGSTKNYQFTDIKNHMSTTNDNNTESTKNSQITDIKNQTSNINNNNTESTKKFPLTAIKNHISNINNSIDDKKICNSFDSIIFLSEEIISLCGNEIQKLYVKKEIIASLKTLNLNKIKNCGNLIKILAPQLFEVYVILKNLNCVDHNRLDKSVLMLLNDNILCDSEDLIEIVISEIKDDIIQDKTNLKNINKKLLKISYSNCVHHDLILTIKHKIYNVLERYDVSYTSDKPNRTNIDSTKIFKQNNKIKNTKKKQILDNNGETTKYERTHYDNVKDLINKIESLMSTGNKYPNVSNSYVNNMIKKLNNLIFRGLIDKKHLCRFVKKTNDMPYIFTFIKDDIILSTIATLYKCDVNTIDYTITSIIHADILPSYILHKERYLMYLLFKEFSNNYIKSVIEIIFTIKSKTKMSMIDICNHLVNTKKNPNAQGKISIIDEILCKIQVPIVKIYDDTYKNKILSKHIKSENNKILTYPYASNVPTNNPIYKTQHDNKNENIKEHEYHNTTNTKNNPLTSNNNIINKLDNYEDKIINYQTENCSLETNYEFYAISELKKILNQYEIYDEYPIHCATVLECLRYVISFDAFSNLLNEYFTRVNTCARLIAKTILKIYKRQIYDHLYTIIQILNDNVTDNITLNEEIENLCKSLNSCKNTSLNHFYDEVSNNFLEAIKKNKHWIIKLSYNQIKQLIIIIPQLNRILIYHDPEGKKTRTNDLKTISTLFSSYGNKTRAIDLLIKHISTYNGTSYHFTQKETKTINGLLKKCISKHLKDFIPILRNKDTSVIESFCLYAHDHLEDKMLLKIVSFNDRIKLLYEVLQRSNITQSKVLFLLIYYTLTRKENTNIQFCDDLAILDSISRTFFGTSIFNIKGKEPKLFDIINSKHDKELLKIVLIDYVLSHVSNILYFERLTENNSQFIKFIFDKILNYNIINNEEINYIANTINRIEHLDRVNRNKGKEIVRNDENNDNDEGSTTIEKYFYVRNGGIIILYPFLQELFISQNLLDTNTGTFIDDTSKSNAVHSIQCAYNKSYKNIDWRILINKLMCGYNHDDVIYDQYIFSHNEEDGTLLQDEIDTLIHNSENIVLKCIDSWPGLQELTRFEEFKDGINVSNFREYMLQRDCKLSLAKYECKNDIKYYWVIDVGNKKYDEYIGELPWDMRIVKTPYMNIPIYVNNFGIKYKSDTD